MVSVSLILTVVEAAMEQCSWDVFQDSMEVESDDDDYADAVHYDDIIDDDMRITNSCRPLSMHSSVLFMNVKKC